MKKYLFGIVVVCVFVGGYSVADTLPVPKKYNTDLCKTLVSPSIGGGDCSLTPKEDKDECTAAGANGGTTPNSCATRYSCETLFTDSKTANKCNFARCENQRGKGSSYCTCKYGVNGDGIDPGIPLNTSIPFLGNCLKKSGGGANDTAALNAFPTIISVASRILVTIIMLAGFIMIVVGGVQWSAGNAKDGKAMIKKVAIGFALLGAMGAILRLINPNFFK